MQYQCIDDKDTAYVPIYENKGEEEIFNRSRLRVTPRRGFFFSFFLNLAAGEVRANSSERMNISCPSDGANKSRGFSKLNSELLHSIAGKMSTAFNDGCAERGRYACRKGARPEG